LPEGKGSSQQKTSQNRRESYCIISDHILKVRPLLFPAITGVSDLPSQLIQSFSQKGYRVAPVKKNSDATGIIRAGYDLTLQDIFFIWHH
jgi:hypothetical protein